MPHDALNIGDISGDLGTGDRRHELLRLAAEKGDLYYHAVGGGHLAEQPHNGLLGGVDLLAFHATRLVHHHAEEQRHVPAAPFSRYAVERASEILPCEDLCLRRVRGHGELDHSALLSFESYKF